MWLGGIRKRETSSTLPHSSLDETLDGVCMIKFILLACLVTKGGMTQECQPVTTAQSMHECKTKAVDAEDYAMQQGFFVAAVCIEVAE